MISTRIQIDGTSLRQDPPLPCKKASTKIETKKRTQRQFSILVVWSVACPNYGPLFVSPSTCSTGALARQGAKKCCCLPPPPPTLSSKVVSTSQTTLNERRVDLSAVVLYQLYSGCILRASFEATMQSLIN